MAYMANYFDMANRLVMWLVDGAQSVISFSYNYYTDTKQVPDAPQLAMYAYGQITTR